MMLVIIVTMCCVTSAEDLRMMPHGCATVDGDLADWQDAQWWPMDHVFWGGPNDISDAKMAVKWDENMIYMAVTYTDADLQLAEFRIAWDGQDSLEVYVDATNSDARDYCGNNTPIDHDEAVGWVCGPQGDTPEGLSSGWTGKIWRSMGDSADMAGNGYLAASNIKGSQVTYELGMPSYSHRASGEVTSLVAGQTVGCDVLIASKGS